MGSEQEKDIKNDYLYDLIKNLEEVVSTPLSCK